MSKVTIENVQAIRHIEFDMPDGTGGVRVLCGPNGAGKTTALKCMAALLGQKISLKPTDGMEQGVIEGFGVTKIVNSKRGQQGGAIEVPSLEGRFDFSDLVEPPYKDDAARNKCRIKALVGLTNQKSQPSDFHCLFESVEEFGRVVAGDDLAGVSDVLDMAAVVKKCAEKTARLEEARIEQETARWQASVEQSKGIKVEDKPPSVADLADKFASAKQKHEAAKAAQRLREQAVRHNESVHHAIAKHNAAKPKQDAEELATQVERFTAIVADLEAKLATSKKTLAEFRSRFDVAMQWEERLVELGNSMMAVVESNVDIGGLACAEQVALAELQDVQAKQQRWDAAVMAKSLYDAIKARKVKADRYRSIALRVGEVVTGKLPKGCVLQVRDGVLGMHYAPRDKWLPLDELSEGERWEACLDVAIEAVGEGGVIPVKQEAWQSLDVESRNAVAGRCRKAKVWLVTGEVSEGPLRVESL